MSIFPLKSKVEKLITVSALFLLVINVRHYTLKISMRSCVSGNIQFFSFHVYTWTFKYFCQMKPMEMLIMYLYARNGVNLALPWGVFIVATQYLLELQYQREWCGQWPAKHIFNITNQRCTSKIIVLFNAMTSQQYQTI